MNGFGTCCDSRLFVASSRTGEVERYCRGTAFNWRVTGRFTPCAPTYVASMSSCHGSSR